MTSSRPPSPLPADLAPGDQHPGPGDEFSARGEARPAPKPPRIHLPFLDGVRGLTALYVVAFHLMMAQPLSYHLPALLFWLTRPLRYGHFAVDMFIVLSGYCLMLPVARAPDGRIPGGIKSFILRRFRRIFPPYWAALLFAIAMILLVRLAGARTRADDGNAFAWPNLLTHFLMIHNLFGAYSDKINLPLWTVAIEWQIYFAFAFLLLPLWRRFGILPAILLGTAVGELLPLLLPASNNLTWTCPWFLGLFAMGMAACLVHFRPAPRSPASIPIASTSTSTRLPAAQSWPWGAIVLALLALVCLVEIIGGDRHAADFFWAKDLLVGAAAAATLAYLTGIVLGSSESATDRQAPSFSPPAPSPAPSSPGRCLARLLQSPPLVALGGFSYSLYLIHVPLMWPIKLLILKTHLSPYPEFFFRIAVAPLLMLPFAYLFHRLFERPFMSAAALPRTRPRRNPSAIVAPDTSPKSNTLLAAEPSASGSSL